MLNSLLGSSQSHAHATLITKQASKLVYVETHKYLNKRCLLACSSLIHATLILIHAGHASIPY